MSENKIAFRAKGLYDKHCEVQHNARKHASLEKTQQKTAGNQASKVLDKRGKSRPGDLFSTASPNFASSVLTLDPMQMQDQLSSEPAEVS